MNKANIYNYQNAFQELHFCGFESQCSAFNMTKLAVEIEGEGRKLLAAPLKGNVMCIGFQKHGENLLPFSKPVPFTYIPGDADIIAIDSLNANGELVVGIVIVKTSRQRRESSGKLLPSYFNIYTELGTNVDLNLDRVAQGCKSIELGFVPYQLYHTDIYNESGSVAETVFLISGSDERVHLYKQVPADINKSTSLFAEVGVEKYLVEFSSLSGIVICMQCLHLPSLGVRLSAVGFRDGRIDIFVVDLFKNSLLKDFTYENDSMVTSLQIFSLQSYSKGEPPTISDYHLLITSAYNPAFVVRQAFQSGFNSVTSLDKSDQYDCCLCSLVGDIDFDGEVEILIGCYGEKLLIYKLDNPEESNNECTSNFVNPHYSPLNKPMANLVKPQTRSKSALQLTSMTLTSPNVLNFPHSTSSFTYLPSCASDNLSTTGVDNCTTDCTKTDTLSNLDSSDTSNNDLSFSNLNLGNETGTDEAIDPREDSIFLGSAGHSDGPGTKEQFLKKFDFVLISCKDFGDPIMGLDLVDLTSDYLNELVVMTMNGVHILQRSTDNVLKVFKEKLKLAIQQKEIAIERLNRTKDGGGGGDNDDDDNSIDIVVTPGAAAHEQGCEDNYSDKSFISKFE